MSTDLSKITTVEAADQAIKEIEKAIARGEAAVIEGSPTDVEMLKCAGSSCKPSRTTGRHWPSPEFDLVGRAVTGSYEHRGRAQRVAERG